MGRAGGISGVFQNLFNLSKKISNNINNVFIFFFKFASQ